MVDPPILNLQLSRIAKYVLYPHENAINAVDKIYNPLPE